MIFAHTLDKVLNGTKQQTRRIIKPNEIFQETQQRVVAGTRTVYQVGKDYAVQPNRGKKAVARILLTGIRCESVSVIDEQDAIAEGFASASEFITAWQRIHGQTVNLENLVWVLEFKLYEPATLESSR
jgi:hypothetical protein